MVLERVLQIVVDALETIAVLLDRKGAIAGMHEVASIGAQRVRGWGIRYRIRLILLVHLLHLLFEFGIFFLEPAAPVYLAQTEQAITHVEQYNLGGEVAIQVGEYYNAEIVIGHEADQGAETINIAAMLRHHMAAIGCEQPAKSIVPVKGLFVPLKERWQRRANHLRSDKLVELRLGNESLSLIPICAPVQEAGYPLRHREDIGIDRPGGTHSLKAIIKCYRLHLGLDLFIGKCKIVCSLRGMHREIRVRHTQGIKKSLLHEVFPALPGNNFNEVARRHIHHVLVLPGRAQVMRWLKIL